jgi:FtsZ-binding cell division protein ZapB
VAIRDLSEALFLPNPIDLDNAVKELKKKNLSLIGKSTNAVYRGEKLQTFNGKVRREYKPGKEQVRELNAFEEKWKPPMMGYDVSTDSELIKDGFWEMFDEIRELAKESRLSGEYLFFERLVNAVQCACMDATLYSNSYILVCSDWVSARRMAACSLSNARSDITCFVALHAMSCDIAGWLLPTIA